MEDKLGEKNADKVWKALNNITGYKQSAHRHVQGQLRPMLKTLLDPSSLPSKTTLELMVLWFTR